MVTRAENDKITRVVVQLVTIYVVYVLGGLQWPAEHFLHYKAMYSNMVAVDVFAMVSIGVYPAIAFIFTRDNVMQPSVIMESAVVFFAISLTVLFPFAFRYGTSSFLRTSRCYQCFLRVSSGSPSLIVHLTQTIAVYVSGAKWNFTSGCDEQPTTTGGGIVGFAIPALGCWFSAFKTLFHRISPMFNVPQFMEAV